MNKHYPHRETARLLNRYRERYPEEKNRFDLLARQLAREEDVGSRKNFTGHLTGSGIVLHEGNILLIFHKKLQRFLQPGGHFEGDDSLLLCAKREVEEETGLRVIPHPWHGENGELPIYIDTHPIPENPKKEEPQHHHHDHTYLFLLEESQTVSLQTEEVEDFQWLPIDHPFEDEHLRAIMERIRSLGLHLS